MTLWTKTNLRRFSNFFATCLESLLPLLLARLHRGTLSFIRKRAMRRITFADKMSVGFGYYEGETECGHLHYDLKEGKFTVQCWPSAWTMLKRIAEAIRLLRLASKIVSSEYV